ncbi:caffeine-induced death protein 2 [Sarocladium strictum]
MASQPTTPELTPQFCFSTRTLRDFLRLSRSSIDDSITQNLNALLTPSRSGFDSSALSQRSSTPHSRTPDPQACQDFRDKVLFPSWEARAEIINYCGMVATSPDKEDPEAELRAIENQKDKERVVNERLDPYSGRFFPREARTEMLASLMRQERGVENIVRARTWEMVQQRCAGGVQGGSWEDAMAEWRNRKRQERNEAEGR